LRNQINPWTHDVKSQNIIYIGNQILVAIKFRDDKFKFSKHYGGELFVKDTTSSTLKEILNIIEYMLQICYDNIC